MNTETKTYLKPSAETIKVITEGFLCESAEIAAFKMENETWEW